MSPGTPGDPPPEARSPNSGGGGEAGAVKARRRLRPLPLREKLYQRVLELRAQGLSHRRIIKKIEEEFGERLSRSTVSFWCRGIHQPRGNVRYDLKLSEELGWVLGAAVGDGRKYGNNCKIEIKGRLEIVKLFAETVAKAFGRDPLPIRLADRGLFCAEFKCARLYYLLTDFEALVAFVESSEKVKRGFLKGFGDTEGSISGQTLALYNTNLELLRWVQKWLGDFGVEATGPHLSTRKGKKFRDPASSKEYRANKDCFYIYVRARSLETFHREIGFRIERKQKRLEEAIKRRKRE